jgi:hypothetical protein
MTTNFDREETTHMSTNNSIALSLWPRRESRAVDAESVLPTRRSRSRAATPRLRRPPKWSARVLPRRVA